MTRPLLFFLLTISKVVADEASIQGRKNDMIFGNYVQHQNFALIGRKPLIKSKVNSVFDCLHDCSSNTRCVSINVNTTTDEKAGKEKLVECELLDFDKYQNHGNFSAIKGIDHYALPSKCDENPCKHNGRCVPVFVTMETYQCKCLPGTKGNNCEHEDFSSCAERFDAGKNDSGIYEIKAPDSTKLNVYCDHDNTTGWTMVFKSVSGVAQSPTPSQLWTSVSLLETPLALTFVNRAHYKNRLIEQWNTLKPSKIRLSIYKNSHEVVKVIFSGTGSSKTNWFAVERVISSPWTDLLSQPRNYFSILGDYIHGYIRSFFMNSVYPGCENDMGWMVLIEKPANCDWEKSLAQFSIVYSRLSTRAVYHNAATKGVGDMMIIYVE